MEDAGTQEGAVLRAASSGINDGDPHRAEGVPRGGLWTCMMTDADLIKVDQYVGT
jgi:hypothetical protein